MKSLIVACPTIHYELEAAREEYGCQIPVKYIPQQLHNDPEQLHMFLQDLIDSTSDYYRMYLCISSCGGGTADLQASSAELVIPRTRDCVDILLSNESSLESLDRPFDGCLFTKGWVDFNEHSDHSLANLTKTKGRSYAEAFVRNLYGDFNKFYLIDTGLGHVEYIQEHMQTMVNVLGGSTEIIYGHYGILRKIVQEKIDGDFIVTPQGGTVDTSTFLSWG